MEILRECRHILNNMRQSLIFMAASNLSLVLLLLIGYAVFEPPILSGLQLLVNAHFFSLFLVCLRWLAE